MLVTPGCCACDEIGALFAGVFCGVLLHVGEWLNKSKVNFGKVKTDGAVISSFLFRIGSDMIKVVKDESRMLKRCAAEIASKDGGFGGRCVLEQLDV